MVLSFDLLLPPLDLHLRVSRHRLAPDDCHLLLCHRQSSLLATRSFLSLALHQFWPLRLLPMRRRIICLICLFAIFGLNGLTCSVLLFITSNFGSWYADCRAFCPGPSSYEDRTLAAWSKKKNIMGHWTCVNWLEPRLSLAASKMVPASVGLMTRTTLCSSSVSRRSCGGTWWFGLSAKLAVLLRKS